MVACVNIATETNIWNKLDAGQDVRFFFTFYFRHSAETTKAKGVDTSFNISKSILH